MVCELYLKSSVTFLKKHDSTQNNVIHTRRNRKHNQSPI